MDKERCSSCTGFVGMKCDVARSAVLQINDHLGPETTDADIRERAIDSVAERVGTQIVGIGCQLPKGVIVRQLKSSVS